MFHLFCPDALTPGLLDILCSQDNAKIVLVCPVGEGDSIVKSIKTKYDRSYPAKGTPTLGFIESELPCSQCIENFSNEIETLKVKWV